MKSNVCSFQSCDRGIDTSGQGIANYKFNVFYNNLSINGPQCECVSKNTMEVSS